MRGRTPHRFRSSPQSPGQSECPTNRREVQTCCCTKAEEELRTQTRVSPGKDFISTQALNYIKKPFWQVQWYFEYLGKNHSRNAKSRFLRETLRKLFIFCQKIYIKILVIIKYNYVPIRTLR